MPDPRRRWPLLAALGIAAALVLFQRVAGADAAQDDLVDRGRQLYVTGCSGCHGADGRGVVVDGQRRGPTLRNAGTAIAYYMLSTGRMPLDDPGTQARRKRPAYTRPEINALVAYIATFGPGPPLPDVEVAGADLVQGGVLFRGNCQPCHNAAGVGGALSYGRSAPSLGKATPEQVAAAIRSGPGQMPVFGPDVLSLRELNDVARYVQYLHDPEDRGGVSLGHAGPIPEGFVAWLFGIGSLLLAVAWIGTRNRPGERKG
jgi:ubiquinol-cytochrome c reductase cytochrome c subunit